MAGRIRIDRRQNRIYDLAENRISVRPNRIIISVLNQKGGVGKTILATSISAGLAAEGEKVLLVDADPQHSALDWGAKRDSPLPFILMGFPTPVLHRAAEVDPIV